MTVQETPATCRRCGKTEPEVTFGRGPKGRRASICKGCCVEKIREAKAHRKTVSTEQSVDTAVVSPPITVTEKAPVTTKRALPRWEERGPAGIIPRPVPGKGPQGEEIVATVWSDHPVALAWASQMGYAVARAGTGEIENEAAYEVVPTGDYSKLVFMDAVVVIRRADYDRRVRVNEAADIKRRISQLPKVVMEEELAVKTIASETRQEELSQGDD